MHTMGRETIRTYRYVRVSIVGAVALLFAALALQIIRDDGVIRSSISAYYYEQGVQGVFVGVLLGAAFSLIAIRGRRGLENALLDLAGMLLPLVALIPTPVPGKEGGRCAPDETCLPTEFVPGVEVGVAALLLVGLLGMVFATWTYVVEEHTDPVAARRGLVAAWTVWATIALWFGPTGDWAPRDRLLDIGHYAAAIPVFLLIVLVALGNARRTERRMRLMKVQVSYRGVYRTVAWAMLVGTPVLAALYWVLLIRPDPAAPHALVFLVEAWLLALFAVFWAAQTAEFWHVGLPPEAREPSAPPADTR